MNATVEALRIAKTRIADPDHWCQRSFARDASGEDVGWYSQYAVKWCAEGALRATVGDAHEVSDLLTAAAREVLGKAVSDIAPVPTVNDQLGHDAVMEMYDRAIEAAEKLSLSE